MKKDTKKDMKHLVGTQTYTATENNHRRLLSMLICHRAMLDRRTEFLDGILRQCANSMYHFWGTRDITTISDMVELEKSLSRERKKLYKEHKALLNQEE